MDAPLARLDALAGKLPGSWLDLTAVASTSGDLGARLELGTKRVLAPGLDLTAFVAGEVDRRGAKAEAGLRLAF